MTPTVRRIGRVAICPHAAVSNVSIRANAQVACATPAPGVASTAWWTRTVSPAAAATCRVTVAACLVRRTATAIPKSRSASALRGLASNAPAAMTAGIRCARAATSIGSASNARVMMIASCQASRRVSLPHSAAVSARGTSTAPSTPAVICVRRAARRLRPLRRCRCRCLYLRDPNLIEAACSMVSWLLTFQSR
jgi:hypothetical protein